MRGRSLLPLTVMVSRSISARTSYLLGMNSLVSRSTRPMKMRSETGVPFPGTLLLRHS